MTDDILKGKRLVVVEDDIENMAVFAFLLKRNGALVIQDYWNDNTLNIIVANLPIDGILLDLMLRRGVTGYDIFSRIRNHPRLQNIPVIAVSASDPVFEIPKARELGLRGFIGKPISLDRFCSQVLHCLEGDPVWDLG